MDIYTIKIIAVLTVLLTFSIMQVYDRSGVRLTAATVRLVSTEQLARVGERRLAKVGCGATVDLLLMLLSKTE